MKRSQGWRRFTDRRETRVAGVFGVGAVSGLILASSLLVNNNPIPREAPSPPSGRLDRPLPDDPAPSLPEIPGTGVLRQGDSGHGVYELQVRLLQVPNIYDGGAIDGLYDKEVRMAVARFQKWYGIRGDETGVYGDHTRHALMLRTK
ncbi:peptidoglycan-binding protein [Streptomyces sp. NPDC001530]|uniref:peptidoglycan-binding domain-containing protein n=1 Tax=Streptomyces sp. NPDC001530 TaxID=3364582 RepID=UPI0036873B6A